MGHPPIDESTPLNWLLRDMHSAFAEIANDVKVPLTEGEAAAIGDIIYKYIMSRPATSGPAHYFGC
jgi:hypothetical protein